MLMKIAAFPEIDLELCLGHGRDVVPHVLDIEELHQFLDRAEPRQRRGRISFCHIASALGRPYRERQVQRLPARLVYEQDRQKSSRAGLAQRHVDVFVGTCATLDEPILRPLAEDLLDLLGFDVVLDRKLLYHRSRAR